MAGSTPAVVVAVARRASRRKWRLSLGRAEVAAAASSLQLQLDLPDVCRGRRPV